MTAISNGTSLLFQIATLDDPDTYATLGAQKDSDWSKKAAIVDVSNKDIPDSHERIGNKMGKRQTDFTVNGFFADSDSQQLLEQLMDDEEIFNARMLDIDTGRARRAAVKCTEISVKGPHMNAQQYSAKFQTDGPSVIDVGITL